MFHVIQYKAKCAMCNGTGRDTLGKPCDYTDCNGTGVIRRNIKKCPSCHQWTHEAYLKTVYNSDGTIYKEVCWECVAKAEQHAC